MYPVKRLVKIRHSSLTHPARVPLSQLCPPLIAWSAIFWLLGSSLAAQVDELVIRDLERPVMQAYRVEVAPQLDGNVLDDPVWQAVPPTTGFWQTTPDAGQPASEKTEIRILYTHDMLYIGVVCFDRNPRAIIVSDSRRDSPLNETDSFQIIFDTYRDSQNGFVFGTNPAGIEYDGQVTREGQEGTSGPSRQQAGSGGGFNINWDGSWEVRTLVSDFGWSAEFAIPFRTLRFPRRAVQSWGVNFQRNIRRRNETAFWAPLPRQFNLYRVSRAGLLEGLEIPSQRNLTMTPYVLGMARKDGSREEVLWKGDAGFDVKFSLTPSLTLDVTYNTDFAQVEVDEQQINLDRFNLFFPEKRPFFLENAGLFSVGNPGDLELFFSRRIGIGRDGSPIPILGGARLSGRVGSSSVGLLNMQTEEFAGRFPGNNFTVARFNRELPNRSSIGAIFTNRQATGGPAENDDYNRAMALDGRWGIGQYGQISGFAARTASPNKQGREHAFKLGASYDSPAWRLNLDYTEAAENFNPELGFLRRRSYRNPAFGIFHRYRPANFIGLHEIRPHMSYRSFWTFDGFQETGFVHLDTHYEWKNGYEFHSGLNLTREGVLRPFEIFPGVIVPAGVYEHREAQLVGYTNQGSWLSFQFRSFIGGFFGGNRVNLNPSMRLRMGESFNTELSLNRTAASLPAGDFTANLVRGRISYSFTPRVFVQSLVQYNNASDQWSMNFRFGWLQAANTGLFVVYNDNRGLGAFDRTIDLTTPDRSLTVKFSRLIHLLD